MFENLTQFSKLLKGAGQILPRVQAMKARLSKSEVAATSDSGYVRVVLQGSGIIAKIEIDDSLIQPDKRATLELELATTLNEAIRRAKEVHVKAVHEIVADLGVPGVDKIIEKLAE